MNLMSFVCIFSRANIFVKDVKLHHFGVRQSPNAILLGLSFWHFLLYHFRCYKYTFYRIR